MKSFIRRCILWSHRWLGLVVGVHFVLLGLSGSYLVYAEEIEAWLKPTLRTVNGVPQVADIEKIIASARRGLNVDTLPQRIQIASEESGYNHRLTFNVPLGEQKRRFVTAYVNASDFSYRGSEVFKETLGGFLFVFHHDLFAGPLGRLLVGLSGVLCLFILLGGLYLWWPRSGTSWLSVLRYKKQRSFLGFNLELHKFLGFYSLILMVIVTFSGIYLAKPDWFFQRPKSDAGSMAAAESRREKPAGMYSLTELQSSLASYLEDDQIAQLRFDPASGKVLALARHKDLGVASWSWDLSSGKLLQTQLIEQRDFQKRFGDLQREWHVGNFWGELGRFLIFLSGLLPLVFYFTGTYFWWKRKQR